MGAEDNGVSAPSGGEGGDRQGSDPVSHQTQVVVVVRHTLPLDLAVRLATLGPVEWGATKEQSDAAHVSDFARTLAITRADHGVGDEPRALEGVYLTGTNTVVCHTGTSPNAAAHARLIVGLLEGLRKNLPASVVRMAEV